MRFLIIQIGKWVLQEVCSQNKKWHDCGFDWLNISVNLSARQFLQKDLVTMVTDILDQTKLPPQHLDLEITETTIMVDIQQAVTLLNQLNAMDITISIDDFGTGYSSLNYLKQFPISTLKIDRSFLSNINEEQANTGIVIAIIALAHSLNLRVVAEGVETPEQLNFLRKHNCDEIQGYIFSKPIPAEQFQRLLAEHSAVLDDIKIS